MILKRTLTSLLCSFLLFTSLPVVSAEGEGESGSSTNESTTSESSVVNNYNTDSFNTYYNYYYENESKYDEVDLVSLNNLDKDAFWRPKYEDLSLPLQEHIQMKDKNVLMKTNGFDVGWSSVDKTNVDTSRALENLGYDFLLYKETVSNTGEGTWDSKVRDYSYNVNRETGYNKPITAPYFIMNIYKALGMDLYDVYFQYKEDVPEAGAYVTRTNPDSYWKLFLNDHPIDYDVYNNVDVEDTTVSRILSTSDAITILAQMLDFYGEPVISKQEEYLLLQVYGNDVPATLTDTQKTAWSYLKSRGIIPEGELDYNKSLSFTDMMDLLMRAGDKDSRTNFKEIQITTDLDDSFIQKGYYQANNVELNTRPKISPIESTISFASATRYDFLIEMDDSISFRFKDTQKLNTSIFISKGPMYSDSPITGSIYNGIVEGRYYHFSVPISELQGVNTLYVNSSKTEDSPANYHIPISTGKIGGVYSEHGEPDAEDSIVFKEPNPFQTSMPESYYVDSNRRNLGNIKIASAAGHDFTATYTFPTEMLDKEASITSLKSITGAFINKAEISSDGERLIVEIASDGFRVSSDDVAARLVLLDQYVYKSSDTTAILGLTGDNLLVSLKEIKASGLVTGYKVEANKDTLVIYTKDKDIVLVNNKNKIIQKGNTYLQVREGPLLFTQSSQDKEDYFVDFRALYGSKGFGFNMSTDSSTGKLVVTFYDNTLAESSTTNKYYRINNEYTYFSTKQYLPYNITNIGDTKTKALDILYKMKSSASADKGDDVEQAYLPFSSSNVLGNYIIYGEYSSDTGSEKYYLVKITPRGILSSNVVNEGDYKSMFLNHPKEIKNTQYRVDVIKLDSASKKYGIQQLPGVGWVYPLREITNDHAGRKTFMSEYRQGNRLLPFAISYEDRIPKVYNFNINYFSDVMTRDLVEPKVGGTYSPIPAAISIQSWFTDEEFVPTISKSTLVGKTKDSKMPLLYYGTLSVKVNTSNSSLTTEIGGLNLQNYLNDLKINGMNVIEKSGINYKDPGLYFITATDFDVDLSTTKSVVEETEIDRKAAELQAFFDKYENITLMDFIYGVDNSMSILYYIVTRVVPLLILCLLTLMLMISMVADMRLVQLFCTRVFDPVKILTFGNHNIMTVRNKYFVLSLIGALTLMGIIQAGNLEKIIMFFVRTYYAIMMFFE